LWFKVKKYIYLDKIGAPLYNSKLCSLKGLNEMAIKISDIPPEGLTLNFDQKIDLFDTGTASVAVTAVLVFKSGGTGIFRVTGHVTAAPLLQCSRCLKSFTYSIDADVNFEIAPSNSLGTVHEHELGKGELDTEFYEGNEIEPIEFLREQLLIALPMIPLHHPECKGLCSRCGADRNKKDCKCSNDSPETSGAFSVLKDLLKK